MMRQKQSQPLPKSVALSIFIYQGLLLSGPRAFRREYGSVMVQAFRQCCVEAHQRKGTYGVLRSWPFLYGELIEGMLEEHTTELFQTRRVHVLQRCVIAIFWAYIIFAGFWLSFQHFPDPLVTWKNLASSSPRTGALISTVRIIGHIAFLTFMTGGMLLMFVGMMQAYSERRYDTPLFLGLCCGTAFLFVSLSFFVFGGYLTSLLMAWLYFAVCIWCLLAAILAAMLVRTHSDLSERVLRYTFFPLALVTSSLGVALVSTVGISKLLVNPIVQIPPDRGADPFSLIVVVVVVIIAAVCLLLAWLRNAASTWTA